MAMSVPPATEHQTQQLLITEVVGRFSSASNATFLARDSGGGMWVYKPETGVRPLWDFPSESLAYREILAYEVSAYMKLDLVPETVEATGPLGPGAAQRYLDPDPDFDQRSWFQNETDTCLWPVAVFDLIVNNADRKLGHMLVHSRDGSLFAIDHGLTFHRQDKLRTVLWGFAGQQIPSRYLEAVAKLRDGLTGSLTDRIATLLSPEEARALRHRTESLLDNPRHPDPPEERAALPWPLW
jgi:hypothetical protein